MKKFLTIILFLLSSEACFPTYAGIGAPWPQDSVYRTPLVLRDQNGRQFDFKALRGHPVIVSMMYTSCMEACPLNVETIKKIRAQVRQRSGHPAPSVVMISFDPRHDTVAQLAMMARMHQLKPPVWRFARPESGDVRAFAATLGISYRVRPNGEVSHNVEIVLLDRQGRIVTRTGQLGQPDPDFVAQVIAEVQR